MGGGRAARTQSQPLPRADDVYVQTIGTSASEVDLFFVFGIDDGINAHFRVTIEGNASFYILAGDVSGFTPVTVMSGLRFAADSARSFEVSEKNRYLSLIADAAGTRVNVTKHA